MIDMVRVEYTLRGVEHSKLMTRPLGMALAAYLTRVYPTLVVRVEGVGR